VRLDAFDFELPPERIAQAPLADRAAARLMVVDRSGREPVAHRVFRDVVDLLPPGAVLVLNETRVIPARLRGRRATGGKVEVLLVHPLAEGGWEAIVRAGGSLRAGEAVALEGGGEVALVAERGGGRWRVEPGEDALALAERVGEMPLPPYIRRPAGPEDRDAYQTVFARVPGAIAAPTAGLHFTPELLSELEARGVTLARILLHVGPGTFLPVRVDDVEAHVMEAERYAVPPATAALIEAARAEGRPVFACGTTAVRALEAWGQTGAPEGWTDLFLYPGQPFHVVEGLITNFHLPRSTLVLLVAAFAGRENVLAAYREAVAAGYRFYSYGDAMLIR